MRAGGLSCMPQRQKYKTVLRQICFIEQVLVNCAHKPLQGRRRSDNGEKATKFHAETDAQKEFSMVRSGAGYRQGTSWMEVDNGKVDASKLKGNSTDARREFKCTVTYYVANIAQFLFFKLEA